VSERVRQGWYTDPFRLHEARYFSAGHPTKLVRDGTQESYDLPPDGAPSGPADPLDEADEGDASDLRRADDGPEGAMGMGEAAGNSITTWMAPM
jgi:hypothetical protein